LDEGVSPKMSDNTEPELEPFKSAADSLGGNDEDSNNGGVGDAGTS